MTTSTGPQPERQGILRRCANAAASGVARSARGAVRFAQEAVHHATDAVASRVLQTSLGRAVTTAASSSVRYVGARVHTATAGVSQISGIISQANSAIDTKNAIAEDLLLTPALRSEFHHVDPAAVRLAENRFGEDMLHHLNGLTTGALQSTSTIQRWITSSLTNPQAVINTTALHAVNLLADHAKRLMPDGDQAARRTFGNGVVRELDLAFTEVKEAVEAVRNHGLDWNRPGFDTQVNDRLAQAPFVRALGKKNDFYRNLATVLRSQIEGAIQQSPHTQNAQMLQSLLKFIEVY